MSFTFQAQSPAQIAAATLATDTTTTSGTFVDLLSATFTAGSAMTAEMNGDVTVSTSLAATISFQIVLDGSAVGAPRDITLALGAVATLPLQAPSLSLTTGSHTLKIQWKTTLGTARCRPQSANEGASFSVMTATT